MASIKISELNELTSVDNADLLPIVDSSANETKKITYENLRNQSLVILSGNANLEANTSTEITLSYPSGFTFNNCVPISFGIENTYSSAYSNKGYNYFGNYSGSMDLLIAGFKRSINMQNDNIKVRIWNPSTDSQIPVSYKIVLIKIS